MISYAHGDLFFGQTNANAFRDLGVRSLQLTNKFNAVEGRLVRRKEAEIFIRFASRRLDPVGNIKNGILRFNVTPCFKDQIMLTLGLQGLLHSEGCEEHLMPEETYPTETKSLILRQKSDE